MDNTKFILRLRTLATIVFILVCYMTQLAQTNKSDSMVLVPMFPGGDEAIAKIINDNLHYPKSIRKARIGGKVIIDFTVDTLGMVESLKVFQGINPELDNEALRL